MASRFLSVKGLVASIDVPYPVSENAGISLDAYNGKYPADIGDYQTEFENNLTPLQKMILKGDFHDE